MLDTMAQLIIGNNRSCGRLFFHVRSQANVVPGHGAIGNPSRRTGHAGRILASFLYAFSVSAAASPHLLVNIILAVIALA